MSYFFESLMHIAKQFYNFLTVKSVEVISIFKSIKNLYFLYIIHAMDILVHLKKAFSSLLLLAQTSEFYKVFAVKLMLVETLPVITVRHLPYVIIPTNKSTQKQIFSALWLFVVKEYYSYQLSIKNTMNTNCR